MNQSIEHNYFIPAGLRVYAIGDVHGFLEPLQRLHEEIAHDLVKNPAERVHIVYLGDYIDRGPESDGVIEFLIDRKRRKDGISKSFLTGNHELAVFEFMKDPVGHDWLRYGGLETLRSYGIEFAGDLPLPAEIENVPAQMVQKIPQSHFEFLNALELGVEVGDYFFVHAGVDPYKPLEKQSENALTRIRQPFLSWHKMDDFKPLEKMIVHGHTVSEEPCIRPHRIGLDTGLYEGGSLTAGVFEGNSVRFLQVS